MLELNRIYNIDCIQGFSQIESKSVDMVLTDIPYGECPGRNDGIRKINKGDADFVGFELEKLVSELVRVCKGSFYIFCGIKQISNVTNLLQMWGATTRLCVWEKTNPSPLAGEFLWLSALEACVFGRFKNSTFNEFCKSNVWREKCGSSKIHPTQKPVGLFRRLVLASSNPGDLILDPFMGSGTTAVACVREKRNFIGFEINEEYYDMACQIIKEEQSQLSLF